VSSPSTDGGGPSGASNPGQTGATAIAQTAAPGRPPLPPSFLKRPLAHRGLHDAAAGRIENSMSAFESAVAAGYGVELDVQLSADGVAMVFHDAMLDRLTDARGPVRARAAKSLAAISLAGTEDRIPTLAAVLARIGGRVPCLVELKDQSGDLGPSDGELEAAVARDLAAHGGRVAVMSFSPGMVGRLAALAPAVPRGPTTDAFAPEAWPRVPEARLAELRRIDVDAVGAAFVSHDRRDLDAPRIAELRARGLPILAWTVRSPAEAAAARPLASAITFEQYLPEIPGRD
jgi:glycerophosphoryl diester phosphodiesterase